MQNIDLTPVDQLDVKVDDETCEVSFYWTEDSPEEQKDFSVTMFTTDSEGDKTDIQLSQQDLFKVIMAACRFLRADLPK